MLALTPGRAPGPGPTAPTRRSPIVYGPWSWDVGFLARGLAAMGGAILLLVLLGRCWTVLGAADAGPAAVRWAAILRHGAAVGLAALLVRGAVRAWRELRSGPPVRME